MKKQDKERPGVICYFDTLRTLEKMSEAAQGRFLMACLKYGQSMETPRFDGFDVADTIRLETLWENVQPRIDKDAAGWADGIMQRRYAAYCKQQRNIGEEPTSFEMWKSWREVVDDKLEGDGFS